MNIILETKDGKHLAWSWKDPKPVLILHEVGPATTRNFVAEVILYMERVFRYKTKWRRYTVNGPEDTAYLYEEI